MAKRPATNLIPGHATHRRTEGDYMAVLLEAVTLDDWRSVVTNALQDAKGGDQQARAWLAQYLIGRPESKAPTPLSVVVNQLQAYDPVASKLALSVLDIFPSAEESARIMTAIKIELEDKVQASSDNPPGGVC